MTRLLLFGISLRKASHLRLPTADFGELPPASLLRNMPNRNLVILSKAKNQALRLPRNACGEPIEPFMKMQYARSTRVENMKERRFVVRPYLERWLRGGTPLLKYWLKKENNYLQKHIERGSKVLDIGCGFGRNIKAIADKAEMVVGVDRDRSVLAVAKKKLSSYKNVDLFLEDAKKLHFKDNIFDYVISMGNTFGGFQSAKNKILNEMIRVSKKRGKIIVSVFSENSLKERIKNLKRANFTIIKIKDKYIYTKEGLITEHFSKKELNDIFKKFGLKTKIKKLNSISYICEADTLA